jgi:hypothetical protein
MGTLELRVVPESLMFLDGWQYGMTRSRSLPLEAGNHTVRVVNPGLKKEKTQQIKVVAGRTTRVDINLLEE